MPNFVFMKKTLYAILASILLVAAPFAASAGVNDAIEAAAPQASVAVVHGGVEVGNPAEQEADLAVYAITGQLVKHTRIPAGATMHIELPSGCYIVRVDGLSRRVVIR